MSKQYYVRFLWASVCMMIAGGLQAALPLISKPAIDEIFISKNTTALRWIPVLVILIFFFKGLCNYGQSILMSSIGLRIITDLRNKLYEQIQNQSLSFFTEHPTGVLMSRITNDVLSVQTASAEAITSLIRDTVTLIALTAVIFYTDWKLALISIIVFPLTIYPIAFFGKKMRKVTKSYQTTMGNLNSLLQETISGTRIVKAFGMEKYESDRFAAENEKLFKYNMKAVSVNAMSSPLMDFLGGLGIAAVIFYGGYNVIKGYSTPGTFFSFIAALLMLYEPIKRLTNVNNTINQGIAGAERIFSIIDQVPAIQDKPDAMDLPPIRKGIEIQNVTFCYEEKPVLKNINLSIRAGEVVAFVGMSGGGKTSLVNLIPRFYDVTEGRILIDGHDIRDVTLKSLRQQIAMVTQQTILFNDSVKNNIAYGNIKRSEDEIINAAKAANAHHFIMRLPQGYESNIGELGTKLSGGEKQRISIARALLKNAPILILDEATSSLDTEAEIEVQEALDNLMRGRTTLVIAHRLSTIRNADRIIVLAHGEIVEEGTHETLLKKEESISGCTICSLKKKVMSKMVVWQRIWSDDKNTFLYGPLKTISAFLSFFYRIVVGVRNGLYDKKIFKEFTFDCPVISVGNLTVGGTGKTPCVMMLAGLLKEEGYKPAVISRGYGGKSRKTVNVVSDGHHILLGPDVVGDEPFFMAKSLKDIPVLTGAKRILTGQTAIHRWGVNILICDDAMQHRQIHRDINLVLMDAGDLAKKNYLLPRGKLREPLTELKRADMILVTRTNETDRCDPLPEVVSFLGIPVLKSIHKPRDLVRADYQDQKPLTELSHRRIWAFCGIAHPDSFKKTLQSTGAHLLSVTVFPDHHRYTKKEIEKILSDFTKHQGDFLITTQKDGVRLNDYKEFLKDIYLLRIDLEILPSKEPLKNFIFDKIKNKIQPKSKNHS